MNIRGILLSAAVLTIPTTGCTVKKDAHLREQQHVLRHDVERRDTLRIDRCLQYGKQLQLYIDETIVEKDTTRRIRREIRRRYTLQRKDSLQDTLAQRHAGLSTLRSIERTTRHEDERHTRKPGTGLWTAGVAIGLIGTGWWLLQRFLRRK